MSVQNGERLATKQDLADMYQGILPYLGGMPEMLANKFSKGDLYSTDEKMIGQWIDGKPLYQKVFSDYCPSSATTKTYNHEIANVDMIRVADIFMDWGNHLYSPIPAYSASSSDNISTVAVQCPAISATTISIRASTDRSAYKFYAVLQYTKTTDSAISIGDDTDYSTDEKIVGTWITGEPIYQKTVYNTTLSSIPNNNWVTYCTIENLKDLILFKFMRAKNDGGTLGVFNDICGSTNGSNVTCISRTTALTLDYSKSYAILQYTKTS